ncbi:hypothetical protein L1049_024208 [Liquidambar formosana]|uniref:protein acetyllysine N-acetyltransferase n=1 Tax=Liquidambar formosana TaxID=63359 RepID=A0AAP0X140_LIQFO
MFYSWFQLYPGTGSKLIIKQFMYNLETINKTSSWCADGEVNGGGEQFRQQAGGHQRCPLLEQLQGASWQQAGALTVRLTAAVSSSGSRQVVIGGVLSSSSFREVHSSRQVVIFTVVTMGKHLVAFTGAGISTSCGIPYFRGPKGVWTLQREGKGVAEASLPFHRAMPSMTHMALVELEKAGILKYLRYFEVETIGMKKTSRRCSDVKCHARLKDTVLDWEGELPPKEMKPAEQTLSDG